MVDIIAREGEYSNSKPYLLTKLPTKPTKQTCQTKPIKLMMRQLYVSFWYRFSIQIYCIVTTLTGQGWYFPPFIIIRCIFYSVVDIMIRGNSNSKANLLTNPSLTILTTSWHFWVTDIDFYPYLLFCIDKTPTLKQP